MKDATVNILLIEDDPHDQFFTKKLIQEIAEDNTQVHFRVAAYLQQALRILENDPVDLVLLDLNLADSYGLSTLEEIKEELPVLPPIIILSGLGDPEIIFKALRKGASDYLIKGDLDAARLKASMTKALNKAVWE